MRVQVQPEGGAPVALNPDQPQPGIENEPAGSAPDQLKSVDAEAGDAVVPENKDVDA